MAEGRSHHRQPLSIQATVISAATATLLAAGVVYALLSWLLGLPLHPETGAQRKLLIEVFKAALAVAAGLGVVVALAVNYRRHHIEEDQSQRDDQRLFTDRFQAAAEHLGHDQPAVRLAGVHSMARLADDRSDQRQTCIDVLCAYLRLPPPAPARSASEQATGNESAYPPTTPLGEIEVRQTIVRLITQHLRIDPADPTQVSWQGQNFDFTGATFDAGTFDFSLTTFPSGRVSFDRAAFSGAKVNFSSTEFTGAIVSFDEAEFSGSPVLFYEADFTGGRVRFDKAVFSGGAVRFGAAALPKEVVSFSQAQFSRDVVDVIPSPDDLAPEAIRAPLG